MVFRWQSLSSGTLVFKYVLFFLVMCSCMGVCTYVQVSAEVRGVGFPHGAEGERWLWTIWRGFLELDSGSLQEQEALLMLSHHSRPTYWTLDSGPLKETGFSLGYLLSRIIGNWRIGGIQGRSMVSIQDAGPLEGEEMTSENKDRITLGVGAGVGGKVRSFSRKLD